jgi:hypothetical protein
MGKLKTDGKVEAAKLIEKKQEDRDRQNPRGKSTDS